MLVSPTVKLEDLKKTRKSITKVLSEACNNYKLTDYTIDLDKAIRMHNFIEDLREKIHDIDNEIKVCEAKIAKDKECESLVGYKYPRVKRTECGGFMPLHRTLTASNSFPASDGHKLSDFHKDTIDEQKPKKDESNKNESQNVMLNTDSYELLSNHKDPTKLYFCTDTRKLYKGEVVIIGGIPRIWNGSEYVDIKPYDETAYIKTLEEEVKSLREKLNDIKEYNSDTIRTDENGRIIW